VRVAKEWENGRVSLLTYYIVDARRASQQTRVEAGKESICYQLVFEEFLEDHHPAECLSGGEALRREKSWNRRTGGSKTVEAKKQASQNQKGF